MNLINESPFAAERAVLHDEQSRDRLVVVVKATYRMTPDRMDLVEEPLPIQHADSFHGGAGGSLRYESDLSPPTPSTDVVLIGHAYAPNRSAEQVDVGVAVGQLSQTVRVFGDRAWSTAGGAPRATRPLAFAKMPLVYERAFGGIDASAEASQHHEREARNPVGVGLRSEHSRRPLDGDPLPNLEDPRALIATPSDRPAPVGFGMIGRSWMPRSAYAGCYDEAWKRQRAPLLPDDFDNRFFQAAHPRLVSPRRLQGGEPVVVTHASPTGRPLDLHLPTHQPAVRLDMEGRSERLPMGLDLVALEPDDERALLVWRGSFPIARALFSVKTVVVEGL